MITFTWILLVLASLNAALGIHSVIIDRAPSWAFWMRRRRHSRLGGWASLLMAAFVALMVIVQNAEMPHGVEISLIAAQFMAALGAAVLWAAEAGRQRA
ncbi:hypothetical protein AB0K48_58300 [Nonomuraea sp. NPDC055795]